MYETSRELKAQLDGMVENLPPHARELFEEAWRTIESEEEEESPEFVSRVESVEERIQTFPEGAEKALFWAALEQVERWHQALIKEVVERN